MNLCFLLFLDLTLTFKTVILIKKQNKVAVNFQNKIKTQFDGQAQNIIKLKPNKKKSVSIDFKDYQQIDFKFDGKQNYTSLQLFDTFSTKSPYKLFCPINKNFSFVWTQNGRKLIMNYSYMFLMPPYLIINEPKKDRDFGIFECNFRRYVFKFEKDEKKEKIIQESKLKADFKSFIYISIATAIILILVLLVYLVNKIAKVHTQAIANYVKVWVMLNDIDLKEEIVKEKEFKEEHESLDDDEIANYAFTALLQ